MKICFLAPNYHPIIGGAETYLYTVTNGLRNRGYDAIVITNGIDIEASRKEKINGFEVYRLTNYWGNINDPTKVRWEEMYFSLLREIMPILDDQMVDIIHVNSLDMAIVGSMMALDLKIPLVCSFHEHAPENDAFGKGKCKFIFSRLPIDVFIAGSKFYYDKATFFGAKKEKVKLIYHGIDLIKFDKNRTSSLREKLGIPSQSLFITRLCYNICN